MGDQKVSFGLQNALNLTYTRICNLKIFPGGYTLGPPLTRERDEMEEREGLGEEGGKGKEIEERGRECVVWTRGEGTGRVGDRHAYRSAPFHKS
jgi:hypothetical protein